MSFARAKADLEKKGFGDRVIVTGESSATVELAAEALGVLPGMIAKTLSLIADGQPILILAEGTAKIDNHKYKETFHTKARMIRREEVEPLIGHAPGGVCPFGVNPGVKVYLDESLRRYETVYPAVGDDHSAVRLSIPELEKCSGFAAWVDVCREPEERDVQHDTLLS